jgi:hypothetical protein
MTLYKVIQRAHVQQKIKVQHKLLRQQSTISHFNAGRCA